MFLKLYRMTGQIDMLFHSKNDKQMEKLKKVQMQLKGLTMKYVAKLKLHLH